MPTEEKVIRKLRAILSADVKGYSLLMSDDEASTVTTLKEYRTIMSKLIDQHTGRVVDDPGDNLLAEFASVVDAVRCAVEIQKILKEKNEALPEDKRLEFRLGVNIGDVIQDQDRLYGEGVNIAARIEGLADPGGVCISRNAYDHIRNKMNLGYEYLGEHSVKNINMPVRVYKLLMNDKDAGKLIGKKPKVSIGKVGLVAAIVLAIILTSVFWFSFHTKPEETGKPSIAVLPFDNMSGDPEQEYFSDGITDTLISNLAKVDGIMVISRNSAFTFKGRSIKVGKIAKELNVKYVLEGSVQKAGDQLRIIAQLIDGETDHHVWTETYDGEGTINTVFDLQDEITDKIVSALKVKLSPAEQVNIVAKGTKSIEAYDFYLKGESHRRSFTPDDYVEAVKYYKKAIELDPNYSEAHESLAYTYWWTFAGGKDFWDKIDIQYRESRLLAHHYLKKAMRKPTPIGYRLNALIEVYNRNYEKGIYYGEKALSISPNESEAMKDLGTILIFADKPVTAMNYLKQAAVLDPVNTNIAEIGAAYFAMGEYENAVKFVELGLAQHSKYTPWWAYSAASHALLGNNIEAKKALDKWVTSFRGYGHLDVQWLYYCYPFKNAEVFDRLIQGLVLAGNKFESTEYTRIYKANQLEAKEIKELLFGRTQVGYAWKALYRLSRDLNGEFRLDVNSWNYSDTGSTWIQNDMGCIKYNKRRFDVSSCGYVYRNPEGDWKHRNEYLMITEYNFLWFSVE